LRARQGKAIPVINLEIASSGEALLAMTEDLMTEETINEIKWTIHETHPEMVKPAREKLSEVVDPEIGMHIIQLGLVRDISIENGIGHVKMILTTPFCPYGPAMIEMTKAKAVEGLNMPVTIEMGMDVWDFSMMEDPSALDWGMYA
jgi:metal-sulfur cluster biosynthetic enzyme